MKEWPEIYHSINSPRMQKFAFLIARFLGALGVLAVKQVLPFFRNDCCWYTWWRDFLTRFDLIGGITQSAQKE
jgi:hypothetical protein